MVGVRVALWFIGLTVDLQAATWDDQIIEGLNFIEEYVLQVPFFLMTLMRYITPTLDNLYVNPKESSWSRLLTLFQLHELPQLGRQDIRPEAQDREPRLAQGHVLPESETLQEE